MYIDSRDIFFDIERRHCIRTLMRQTTRMLERFRTGECWRRGTVRPFESLTSCDGCECGGYVCAAACE